MGKKDSAEWLIHPRTRFAVGHTAGLAGYAAAAIIIFAVLDPLLWFSGQYEASNAIRNTGDILYCLWVAVLGWLVYWCHTVLLAVRGFGVTRFICLVAALFSCFLLAGSVYTVLTHELLLRYQLDLPLYLAMAFFISCVLNLNNMAAAPLRLRVTLSVALGLLMLSGSTFYIYDLILPFTILKTAACALLYRPLLTLQGVAPRISALPPQE